MWEIPYVDINVLALIISVLALIAAAAFYFMSARQLKESTGQLQHTMNVLGRYLKATIKNADVDLNIDKKGNITGLDITLHADPVSLHVQGGPATLTLTKATGEKEST